MDYYRIVNSIPLISVKLANLYGLLVFGHNGSEELINLRANFCIWNDVTSVFYLYMMILNCSGAPDAQIRSIKTISQLGY
jgi:hypothetical protein